MADDIEAMHRHLDAHPDDHSARLVLADRLQDEGDEKAEGYRALAANEMHPMLLIGRWVYLAASLRLPGAQWMPHDWHSFYDASGLIMLSATRREAEDQAALSFARLPAARQRELLAKLYDAA